MAWGDLILFGMNTLLNLDIKGRVLDLPQSSMPYPLYDVYGGRVDGGNSGVNGKKEGNENWD